MTVTLSAVSQNDTLFRPNGKPIVQVFGNFDSNLSEGANQKYRFWIGRAHFGYQYSFSEQWQAKIVLDAGRPTTAGYAIVYDSLMNPVYSQLELNEGSYYTMTLKFASLEWKPADNITLQAGSVLLNHFITQEKFWGYRYVAQTFQDRYFGLPSADLGFIGYYKVNKKFGFDFSLTNGEGFRSDQDWTGSVKIASGIDFNPFKFLQTRIYYEYFKQNSGGLITEQQMFSAFAGYRFRNKFRIGAEYNYRLNHLFVKNLDIDGVSVFGSFTISKKLEYFLRYDYLRNINNLIPEAFPARESVITGFQFSPVKGVNLALNYQVNKLISDYQKFSHHALFSFEYKF